MALKVAMAVGGTAKSVFRPALLCRPWEVVGAHEAPRRCFSVSTCLVHTCVYGMFVFARVCIFVFVHVCPCLLVCRCEYVLCLFVP
ncbi:isocitrate dehydrogenase (NAD(+)) 3 non-catalytic subunit gamma [Phyllostomus discolor]|uniref:Isocitrate dehydrogenase (NAD(+)) 3 non-catalytic subunit gamma n=1 Tax=Phyllostomus discolor TaxID=89673 RepID=A0A833Z5T0_9CHIR|nr:isocitrate dehydrogenase (NAD(+)) 3 non-catalytic subunit gamma [Phyllostomus discolor]